MRHWGVHENKKAKIVDAAPLLTWSLGQSLPNIIGLGGYASMAEAALLPETSQSPTEIEIAASGTPKHISRISVALKQSGQDELVDRSATTFGEGQGCWTAFFPFTT